MVVLQTKCDIYPMGIIQKRFLNQPVPINQPVPMRDWTFLQ
ncbi:hypothetical protein [Candidatus Erwinia haradaeae]|nr:hypothetical protein [Candidatus Erwinia haradaeae]